MLHATTRPHTIGMHLSVACCARAFVWSFPAVEYDDASSGDGDDAFHALVVKAEPTAAASSPVQSAQSAGSLKQAESYDYDTGKIILICSIS